MTQNNFSFIRSWLGLICILIVTMVALGGITRLTQSGLSMSQWKFYGTLPPMNENEWMAEFNRYQSTPEAKLINFNYTLTDFKSIYRWEYIHRLTGRITGALYLLPFLFFFIRKRIPRKYFLKFLAGFLLIASQGVLGWIMVKSGLKNKPHVDHFLLAAHLSLALTTLLYIFNLRLSLRNNSKHQYVQRIHSIAGRAFIIIIIQVILGALVAGLKGGLVYGTFPMMGDYWIPPEITEHVPSNYLFDAAALQFIHRLVALIAVAAVLGLVINVRKNTDSIELRKLSGLLVALILLQPTTGIISLLYQVPVFFGVLHQLGGVALLLVTFSIQRINRSGINTDNSKEEYAETSRPAANNHDQSNLQRFELSLVEGNKISQGKGNQ